MGVLCLDGKTKCFDKNGDGYVRSEAISVIFLQKAKDAKRIYAEVFHSSVKFGLNLDSDFLSHYNTKEVEDFLSDFYKEAGVSPTEVEYVEANAVALADTDKNELEAISHVFGKESTVLVGSVKSNMGNSEPASGVCALAKVCLAYHKGIIPGNLHYSEPLDTPAIRNGRVKVVSNNTPFKRGFTAINSFMPSGSNCHVLLKGHFKRKDLNRYKCNIPRLVLVSGRHDQAVGKIFDTLRDEPFDPELIGLLHNIYQQETTGHTCRGYAIIDGNNNEETTILSKSIEQYPGGKRPLWLVYSGMGSQWAGMGAELMRIPIFAAAIEKCHKVLQPKGIDIIRIITEPDSSLFDYILNCFVGIAAVQIGLTDILKAMNIVPDNIIGHSVGEMGCAYFDGCFSTEDMILAAYSRGKVSVETEFIKGSMAAVGLGYKEIMTLCPPEIDVACHNSSESSTISGPVEIVEKFVSELMANGVFAKVVPSANIAYHSRYISHAGPVLMKRLKEVIKSPVPRSEKWICTSLPADSWNDPIAKYSSPEYHTNNLLSPVYFEESARLIPANAVVVEVAPHGLLQAILKRSHKECTHIPLTRRGVADPVKFLFEAVGKLFQEGYNPKVDVLYPQIEFPVSTETQMMSHLVEWEHSEDWAEAINSVRCKVLRPSRRFAICVQDDEFKYMTGHIRDGKNVYPEAAIIFHVWETLAMYKEKKFSELSVVFRDIHFHGDIVINSEESAELSIDINKGNDYFEVTYNNGLVASGYIVDMVKPKLNKMIVPENEKDDIILNSQDVYKCLALKGYAYHNEFQSISSFSLNKSSAKIKWNNNWVTFIDSLIQLNIFEKEHDSISVPKLIKTLTINTFDHMNECSAIATNDCCLPVQLSKLTGVTRCGGVEMRDIIFNDKQLNQKQPDVLESLSFVPYNNLNAVPFTTAILVNIQLVSENAKENEIVIKIHEKTSAYKKITSLLNDSQYLSRLNLSVEIFSKFTKEIIQPSNLLITTNLLNDEIKTYNVTNFMEEKTFFLTLEDKRVEIPKNVTVITSMEVDGQLLLLLKKKIKSDENIRFVPIVEDNIFSWVPTVQFELQKNGRVILVSEKQVHSGITGLLKKLKKTHKNNFSVIELEDDSISAFDPKSPIFNDQIKKNLSINVFKKGEWGAYYYLPKLDLKYADAKMDYNLIHSVSGDVNSLVWSETKPMLIQNNLIKVCFAGPSGRDIQKIVGITGANNNSFGMDFSGIDKNGNRVMGLIPSGSLASTVQPDPYLLWPVPKHWTLEEAASVPLPYIHAFYCLIIKGQLRTGQSVFVTGGAGALGQAVISICLDLGCNVYTSVGDVKKKQLLMKLFPQLNDKNIGYSRNSSFYDMVVRNTEKKRCDFVISTVCGSLREFAMKCTGFWGYFLDISKYDMKHNEQLGMFYLEEDRAYKAVDLSNIFLPENIKDRQMLQRVLSDGIVKGSVKPLTHVVYTADEVSKAFRLISHNNNRGRVLIKIRNSELLNNVVKIMPRVTYSAQGTHVVVCDNSEIGIELANRLVENGVRNLILNLKSKNVCGYLENRLLYWSKVGVNIKISSENLQSEDSCMNMLRMIRESDEIHGIFIVQYSTEVANNNLDQENFITKRDELITPVLKLDIISRNNCLRLRNFVVITRAHQNIVEEYTTSVVSKILQARYEIGLPALVFRTEVGHQNLSNNTSNKIRPQTIETTMNALEISIKHKLCNAFTYDVNKSTAKRYLERISEIFGVENIEDIDSNLFVKDIIFNETKIEEFKKAIKDVNELDYSFENICNMTLQRLKSLGNTRIQKNTNFESGVGAFYSFIDTDEILATEDLVLMKTISSGSTEHEEDVNYDKACLMLIPGFEGHHHIFKSMSERLKIQAMTCQLSPDMVNSNIPDIAVYIKKSITERFQIKNKFYLMGYSFGVNIALEIAALLEKDGLVGVVYCLDSSPEVLQVQMDAYLGKFTEQQLQNAIIEHLCYVMTGERRTELKTKIQHTNNWSDKIKIAIHELKDLVSYSAQYKKAVMESAYNRMLLARKYKPDLKLKSELILLKGIPHPNTDQLSFDYGLSKYSYKPVRIYDISSDFATATEDCRVSNIVNQTLDLQLLQDFESQNLCETYLTSPFKTNN